jgi:hypothetical protein
VGHNTDGSVEVNERSALYVAKDGLERATCSAKQ